MSNELQAIVAGLIHVFRKYAAKDGDPKSLSKADLKLLLKEELGGFENASDKAKLDQMFQTLDANADGVVDFQEYVTYVAAVSMLCNEQLKSQPH